MAGRPDGSGFMMTVPFGLGYLAPAGHGARPASHSTCGNRAPPVFPAVVVPPQAGWVFSRLGGALPSGAWLRAKQFAGSPPNSVIWPKSELLGFPKKPLCRNVLCSSASPYGSSTQPKPGTLCPPEPAQVWCRLGVPCWA